MIVSLDARDLLRVLRENGGTLQQAEAIFAAAAERVIRRRCERAIERALFHAAQTPPFSIVAPNEDEAVPLSLPKEDRLGRKQIARKAVLMAPGLAPQTKSVIGALIDRANAETGFCNPSRLTIAKDARIIGLNAERAVLRGIQEAERDGLLKRRSGTGRGHSTVYTLNWHGFGELFDQIEGRSDATPMWAAMGRRKRDTVLPGNGDKGDANVPLTHKDKPSVLEVRVERARAQHLHDPAQRELRLLVPVPSSATAMRASAERRVMDDIEREAKRRPSFNVSGLTPAQWLDVYAIEASKRGQGIALIRTLLHGPPPNAVTGG